jgi:hypothetical protein
MDIKEIAYLLLQHAKAESFIANNTLFIFANDKAIFTLDWDYENNLWIAIQHHRSIGIEWCPSYGIEMLVTLFKECL